MFTIQDFTTRFWIPCIRQSWA